MQDIKLPLKNSCLYVYTLEPFEVVWASDSELRKELVGEENGDSIVENKDSVIDETTPYHSYEEVIKEIKEHFAYHTDKPWKKILNLRKTSGDICPFLATSVPYESNNNGKIDSIVVKLEELPNGDDDIKQLKRVSNNYYKELHREKLNKLSDTEYEVFIELVSGKSVTQIADETYRSRHTIESHSATIKKKLECQDIYELMHLGYQVGVLSRED